MTLSGLEEIGLNGWPAWFRSLNPGYFATDSTQLKSNFGRRGKGRNCNGGNGCCGDGCRGGLNLGATHVKAERLRAAGKTERQMKEELAEQVMTKLRGAPRKELEKKVSQREKEKPVSGSVMLERASIKDAKDWEDEGSEASEEEKEKEKVVEKANGAKRSLLD